MQDGLMMVIEGSLSTTELIYDLKEVHCADNEYRFENGLEPKCMDPALMPVCSSGVGHVLC